MASQSDILRAGIGSPAVNERLRERPLRTKSDDSLAEPANGLEGRKQRLDERRSTDRERTESAGGARNDPSASERVSKRREGTGASFEERLAREAVALERRGAAEPAETEEAVVDEDAPAEDTIVTAEVAVDPEALLADALAGATTLPEDVDAGAALVDANATPATAQTTPAVAVAEPVAPAITNPIPQAEIAVEEPHGAEAAPSEHASADTKSAPTNDGPARSTPAIEAGSKDATAAPAIVAAAAAPAVATERPAAREASATSTASTANASSPFDAASTGSAAEALTEAPVAPAAPIDAPAPERASEAAAPEVRLEATAAATSTTATEAATPHRSGHAVESALPDARAPVEAPAAPERSPRAEFRSVEEAREILSQWRLHVAPESERVLLELRPAALGSIAIQLRVDAGRVEAIVRSPRRSSLDALRAREGELRTELERSGLAAERITFELGDAPNESSGETPSRSSAAARALQNALVLERAREGLDTYA